MAPERVVIVGGGGAGDTAAFGLRKNGFEGEVLILSADRDRPYDRPYLSKEYLRGEVEADKVYLHDEAEYARNRIELRLGQRVSGGSIAEGRLTLAAGGHAGFDTVIIATGGSPRRPPGAPPAENVFTLRSLSDAGALRDAIRAGRRLLLIGAGFIGAEVGASARTMGKEVLMVESAPVPLARALGEDVGRVYAGFHQSKGVDVRTATTVTEWHLTHGRVTGITLSSGAREEVDVVLLAVGIQPNVEVARALGLTADTGGVTVDAGLRAASGVYCAGDIALHPHPVFGRAIRVEHWEVAKAHGRTIAKSIAAAPVEHRTLPYFWSDQYDLSLEYRGHASNAAQTVWRGDRGSRRFSVFYMAGRLVEAVLSVNDPEVNKAAGVLVQARSEVDPAALASADVDLAELAPGAAT